MKRRRILGLLAVLPFVGAAGKCDKKKPEHHENNHNDAHDVQPDPYRVNKDLPNTHVVALSAWIEPQYGPYRVQATAKDLNTGDQTTLTDDPTDKSGTTGELIGPGRQWKYTLAFPAGHRCEVNVHVTASKPGSTKGYIALRTIDRRPGQKSVGFNGLAAASLYTICE
jgi:hypothetical protein